MKESLLRRCVAEFLGTFAIVFFGCGAIATLHGQPGAHLAVNLVFGLAVAASIYALGHISAAHFNPAVSVGFAVAKRFPWREVPYYALAQLLGAVAASAVHRLTIGEAAQTVAFGATVPAVPLGVSLTIEAILTFFLMLVIISVATDKRANPAIPGLAIGMAVALGGLFGGPLSGSSMNPARSIGPALFAQGETLAPLWLYIAGPTIGAITASRLYEWLRGAES